MSTPERQQDPGDHGYGGVKQDFPAHEEEREPPDRPRPKEAERIEGPRPDADTSDDGG